MTEAELLAQIYAAPDDDGPRQVYADWLLDRGDPYGEFIALQLERARSRARKGGRQREDELAEQHALAWAAALEPAVVQSFVGDEWRPTRPVVEFQRGFPSVVTTEAINTHLAWSTVTSANVPPHDDRCHVGALRAVTAATNADIAALATLTKPLAIEQLVWGWKHDPKRTGHEPMSLVVPPAVIQAFGEIQALPQLHRLEVSPTIIGPFTAAPHLRWLWDAAVTRSLAELLVPGRDLAGWLEVLEPTPLRRFELVVGTEGYHWYPAARFVVVRDARGALGDATVFIYRSTVNTLIALPQMFEPLDGRLTSVRIAIASKQDWARCEPQRATLAATLARLGIAATIEHGIR